MLLSSILAVLLTTATLAPARTDRGFITNHGTKYLWSGTGRAFVPNFVMLGDNEGPDLSAYTESDINAFLDDMFDANGFNGVHVPVYGQWFHIGNPVVTGSDATPDQATFDQLKMIITTVYARGGAVHLWAWGDDARSWSPSTLTGGIMGAEEKRVWDKVYDELNTLPGWTLGYGFDLHEWVNGTQLKAWHDYCHAKSGWQHLLGARAQKNVIDQIYDGLDYNGYENHLPRYDLYVQMLADAGDKPAFSEDRFRVRGRDKDPTADESRLMMWDATMAGGVAGIWGYLGSETGISRSYPNADQMLCYGTFWKDRFLKDMVRDNSGTDGYCLKNGTSQYVYYKENTSVLTYTVNDGTKPVVAVDCKKAYAEIPVGTIGNGSHTFTAPYVSDWALAVGTFTGTDSTADTTAHISTTDDDTTAVCDGTLFDVDLTAGTAGGGAVTGGAWDNGWKVTAATGQRIVFDCGYNVANGYIEASFTIDESPFASDEKTNYFGAFESASLDHVAPGDKVYVRSGRTKYAFSRIKASYKPFDATEWEHNIGSTSDWKVDGTTVHTIRITWQDGTITYEGPGGTATKTYTEFDALRYVFIGSEKRYGRCLKGQKLLAVKVVDLDGGQCDAVGSHTPEQQIEMVPMTLINRIPHGTRLHRLDGRPVDAGTRPAPGVFTAVNDGTVFRILITE